MNLGILFGLTASLFFAFSYISLKRSYREFPPSVAFFLDALFGLLIWIPVALSFGINTNVFLTVLPWAVASAILSEAYFFYVLSKGEVSITGTILASYPIYTAILSRFINNEILTGPQLVAVFVTIVGTLIVSIEKDFNVRDLKKKSYIFWALSGAIAIGLSDSLSKHAIDRISLQDFLFALALVQVPVSLIYLKLEKETPFHLINLFKDIGKYKFALIGSFLNIVGVLFLWLAFNQTLASIASPLTATYPVLMVILAYLLLKEKINRKDYVGIFLVLAGILLISIV